MRRRRATKKMRGRANHPRADFPLRRLCDVSAGHPVSPPGASSREVYLPRRVPVGNATAPIGLARPLFVLFETRPGGLFRWTLRFLRYQCPNILTILGTLSLRLGPSSEFHRYVTVLCVTSSASRVVYPLHFFRGFFPCDVFPAMGSH